MKKWIVLILVVVMGMGCISTAVAESKRDTLIDAFVDTISTSLSYSENIEMECEYVPDADAVCVHMTYTAATAVIWDSFDDASKQALRDSFNEIAVVFSDGRNTLTGLEDLTIIVTMTTSDGIPMLLSCNGIDVSWMIEK